MDSGVKAAIETAVEREPFARSMGFELLELGEGYSRVEMIYDPARHDNIYGRAHGGAVFGLIDEAFETAGQTDGTVAVAMNVNVTYICQPGARRPALRRGPAHRPNQTHRHVRHQGHRCRQPADRRLPRPGLSHRQAYPIFIKTSWRMFL